MVFLRQFRAIGRCLSRSGACCMLIIATSSPVIALDDTPLFRFNAFGTLGAVYNESDDIDFVRDLSQPSGPRGEWSTLPDTILGAQISARPAAYWDAVLQAVSRYDYTGNYDPRITWAFVKYAPDVAFNLRLGRIGYDAYLEGDSRNVGYSFLTVRQPIEYFGTLELTYIDGADVVFKTLLGEGLLTAKLFVGLADEKLAARGGKLYDLDNSDIFGGYLAYEQGDWRIRAGGVQIEFANSSENLAPLLLPLRQSGRPAFSELADNLVVKGKRLVNWNVGLYYDQGSLQAQLLYNHRQSETRAVSDGYATYARLSYRISTVTPYIGYVYADSKLEREDLGLPAGHPVKRGVERTFVSGLFEQRTWLAGFRYDFAENVDVKLQVDVVDAPEPQGGFFADEATDWDGKTTVFSVTMDFVF